MTEEPLPSWFLSSSPEEDQNACEMYRYLGYHQGGTGIRRAAKSIPLVSGNAVHEVLAELVREEIAEPRNPRVQELLDGAKERYWNTVMEAGFQDADKETVKVFDEQCLLIDHLVLGWLRTGAKSFYERFRPLVIEQEMPLEIPWGNPGARLIRGSKPDLVVENKVTRNAGVVNWKTSSDEKYLLKLPGKPQTMMECMAAEQHLGRPVRWFMLYGLIKGPYGKTKLPTDGPRQYSGPRRQDTPLCYAWHRPFVPGLSMVPEDWQPYYNYVDREGKDRKLGKQYTEEVLVPAHLRGMKWLDMIPQEKLNKMFVALGPFWVNPYAIEQYLRGLAGRELRWVEQLRAARESEERLGWASEEHQRDLDGIFSRNYAKCDDMYFRPCPMKGLCTKGDGWKELAGFVPREPHYEAEQEMGE